MNAAVQAAAAALSNHPSAVLRIGVYANAFSPEPPTDTPYAGISQLREDLTPEYYLDCATRWVHSGATLVGGCCGIGPEHISALRAHFR